MKKTSFRMTILLMVLTVVGLVSCGTPRTKEPVTLRIGTLQIIKTLPLYVAEQEGFFAQEGIKVEIVTFSSARERDTAMQAGDIDGAGMDLIAVALLNKAGIQTRAIRVDQPEGASFAIISSPNSSIRTSSDLKNVPIAISHNTIIEFVATELLKAEGLKEQEIQFTEVSAIPVRMEMLSQGKVQAATLPSPMDSLAISQGAHLILDDTIHSIPPTVIAFRQESIDTKPDAVKRFLRAFEKAVDSINSDPSRYAKLFVEKANIPEQIRDALPVPKFYAAAVPTANQVQMVMDWMVTKGLLESAFPYEKMVNGSFLP